jgi:hypothetical protein
LCAGRIVPSFPRLKKKDNFISVGMKGAGYGYWIRD